MERRSYDAFGERRDPAWGSPPILLAEKTSRGFTGHEDDEELGLVNLKGRLYDPHLGRFLSPDPFVSRPHFSQSWNKYSYVLNNPLAYVDPTGFTEDDAHAADPFPGFTMWTPWPGPPLHVTITPGIDEDAAVEGPLEAAEAGASSVPIDVAATGNVAGAVPQPSPVGNALPRGVSNTIDFIMGVHDAADEFAYNAGKTLALNALTFGGYGTYQLGNTLWNGYQEDGILGALNAVNPAALIKEGWNKTLDQIDKGDYRAAGREGGRTAVIIGSTAISAATIAAAVVNAAVAKGAAAQAGAAAKGVTAGEAGAYGPLRARSTPGDLLTPHHMPQAARGFTSRTAGGALVLPQSEHAMTRTFGGRGFATLKNEAGMNFRNVLARDMRDIRQLFGPKYDQGLRELLQYYKDNFPELMVK